MTPNPLDASTYNHRFVTVHSGNRYHLVDQPPAHWRGSVEEAPTILMCHGFPDLWYGWRYQIAAFAARGFRVLCPSQLGYGGSSQPGNVEAYSYKSVAYDMNGLLDAVGAGKVIVFGHDWGGMVAWRFADYFPHRVICIASVCTPYMPPAGPSTPYVSTTELVRTKLPNFGYQAFFERQDTASKIEPVLEQFFAVNFSATVRGKFIEAGRELPQFPVRVGEMEKNIDRMMREKQSGSAKPVPKDPEYQYYLDTFHRYGLHHPLNWYRTRQVNHAEEQLSRLPTFSPEIPALMIPAEKDPALPPAMAKSPAVMKCFPGRNLRVSPPVKGADHWLLQDVRFRDRVTDMLADFVDEVLTGKWKPAAPSSKL